MSMSSLSAQLASIHASSKNSQHVGSTLSTSRRHEDAIGRGLYHSTQVGHAVVLTANTAAVSKPSVIYPNAKTAADVPLTILRENAISSLYQLNKLTSNPAFSDPSYVQTLCGLASIKFERGLAMPKENEAIDSIIRDLLYLLSSAMAQERPSTSALHEVESLTLASSTTSCFASCLHIVEYLVRRYDLHVHSMPLIEHWLVSLLPHHEHALFSRVLQLVDLASLPTWSFLRPFAATSSAVAAAAAAAKTKMPSSRQQQHQNKQQQEPFQIVPPTRSYLAKHVSQHTALVLHVAQLAQRMAKIHAKEVMEGGGAVNKDGVPLSSWPPPPTRRGISHVLSFCAAILVEALQGQSNRTGTLDEATLRTLLPFLLTACGGSGEIHSKINKKHQQHQLLVDASGSSTSSVKWSLSVACPEYRGWGHVLASTIVELGVLSAEVQKVLLHTLVHGALELDRAFCAHDKSISKEERFSQRRTEAASDSILVILSVFARIPYQDNDNDDNEFTHKTLLPKVGGLASQQQQVAHALGVPRLAHSTIKTLAEWDAFVPAIKYLHTQMDMDVTNLVAAILAVALHRVTESNIKTKKVEHSLSIILDLIQEKELLLLWTDRQTCLTSSFVSALVIAFSKREGDAFVEGEINNVVLTSLRSILDSLRRVHSRGADDGVAHAVVGTHYGKHRKARRKRMALLLGVSSTKQLPSHDEMQEDDNPGSQEDEAVLSTGNLLPPRVAMEHSDASIRLEAVQRAVREAKDGALSIDDSLKDALIRRFCVDDHLNVALAAGEALCEMIQSVNNSIPFSEKFASMALSALYRWKSYEGNDQHVKLISVALVLAGHSIRPCSSMALSDSLLGKVQCCIEGIIVHLEDSLPAGIRSSALQALQLALGVKPSEKESMVNATELFFSNELTVKGLNKIICDANSLNSSFGSGENILENALRKKYVWLVLQMLLDQLTTHRDAELAATAFSCCLLALSEVDKGQSKVEMVEVLRRCLEKCVESKSRANHIDAPCVLVSLAAYGQDVTYESVCVHAIQVASKNVVDISNNVVPSAVVLFEACLRPGTPSLAIDRLLSLIKPQSASPAATIVPLLALLAHPDQLVRSRVLKTVSRFTGLCDEGAERDFFAATARIKSSIIIDGAAALPKLLAGAVRGAESNSKAAEFLLGQCVTSASSSPNGTSASSWLSMHEASGGNCAALIVLNAAELAGEQTFPLSIRWKYAGEPLFNILLGCKEDSETPATLIPLMHTVIRMLKGVVVDENSALAESSNVIISSGPGVSGTRTRTYSVGKAEGVTFIKTFPKSMGHAIRDCLTAAENASATVKQVVRLVLEEILGRESWANGIFTKLDHSLQKEITWNLLNKVDGEDGDIASSAFRCLPVQTRDIAFLLSRIKKESGCLSQVTLIAEVVQARASLLFKSSHRSDLITSLFELLTHLSCEVDVGRDTDGLEFARHSLMLALHEILQLVRSNSDESPVATDKLVEYAKSVVHLLSEKGGAEIRPLVSHRSRSTAIGVLAMTCSLLPPDSVLNLLVSTMSMLVTNATVGNHTQSLSLAKDFLTVVVPVYCQLAVAANMSLKHLFSEFVAASRVVTVEAARNELFGCLVKAVHSTLDGANSPCGALLVVYLAKELKIISDESSIIGFVAGIISQHFPPAAQLSAVGEVVHVVNGFLTGLSTRNEKVTTAKKSPLTLSIQEIEIIAGWRSEDGDTEIIPDSERYANVVKLTSWILSAVVEALSSGALRKAVRARTGSGSKLCLCLWQDLLLLQSILNCDLGNPLSAQSSRLKWELCVSLADDALQALQAQLPADVFLAAVSTLMTDDATEELQARSLRLVADRVSGMDPTSAEASLFLEQVPKFVEVIDRARGPLVTQSALIATEKMARSLRINSGQSLASANEVNYFLLALERASDVLVMYSGSLTSKDSTTKDDSLYQLISSAALACATFVRVVTIRCLPILPKLVTSLLTVLSSANSHVASKARLRMESRTIVFIVQVSVIRALTGLCDVVPQFLGPYLNQLLSRSTLLSVSIHRAGKDLDLGVTTETELLLSTLAKRIPSRQLVPCVANAIGQCQDVKEVCVLIAFMKSSIEPLSQADTISQRTNLLRSLLLAYEFESAERDSLLSVANEFLMVFVLKLSEVQLLSLYAHLRDWRGELDKLNPDSNAARRYAFWRLSDVLTKELKSLFLPCLSTVIGDAIDELEIGAKSLCVPKKSQKVHSGKKKRRLENENEADAQVEYGRKSLLSLEPLLACLDSALKADARDGGKWIRADDGQRYNSLLEPLGKLLRCRLPPDFQTLAPAGYTMFHQLVLGTDSDSGNVVNCLTALAAAVGNEQLWKPLNHHILEACGDESRTEVRKAGISCLLKVIRLIGDEYMILLPECLPMLSELLEDADEEIVALAQECVAVGEELLGESLQDSLR